MFDISHHDTQNMYGSIDNSYDLSIENIKDNPTISKIVTESGKNTISGKLVSVKLASKYNENSYILFEDGVIVTCHHAQNFIFKVGSMTEIITKKTIGAITYPIPVLTNVKIEGSCNQIIKA